MGFSSLYTMCIVIYVVSNVVVVVAAAIGEVVVEAGETYGSPGHQGIEARRRAWVHRFSSAPWVHDPPVGY